MIAQRGHRAAALALLVLVVLVPVWGGVAAIEHIIDQHRTAQELLSRLEQIAKQPRPTLSALEAKYRSLEDRGGSQGPSGESRMTDEQALARLQGIVRASALPPVQISALRLQSVAQDRNIFLARGSVTLKAPVDRVFQVISQIEHSDPLLTVESLRVTSHPSARMDAQSDPQAEITLNLKLHFVRLVATAGQ